MAVRFIGGHLVGWVRLCFVICWVVYWYVKYCLSYSRVILLRIICYCCRGVMFFAECFFFWVC